MFCFWRPPPPGTAVAAHNPVFRCRRPDVSDVKKFVQQHEDVDAAAAEDGTVRWVFILFCAVGVVSIMAAERGWTGRRLRARRRRSVSVSRRGHRYSGV